MVYYLIVKIWGESSRVPLREPMWYTYHSLRTTALLDLLALQILLNFIQYTGGSDIGERLQLQKLT